MSLLKHFRTWTEMGGGGGLEPVSPQVPAQLNPSEPLNTAKFWLHFYLITRTCLLAAKAIELTLYISIPHFTVLLSIFVIFQHNGPTWQTLSFKRQFTHHA